MAEEYQLQRERWIAAGVAVVVVALIATMIALTTGGGPTVVPPTATTPAPHRPAPKPVPTSQTPLFAPDSVWNARVDGNAKLAPDSSSMVAHLTGEAKAAAAAA